MAECNHCWRAFDTFESDADDPDRLCSADCEVDYWYLDEDEEDE